MENEILSILAKNSRVSNEQIAIMLGMKEEDVKQAISDMEEKNVIIGYPATVNWEKTDKEVVMAYIAVRVTPQRERGFDKVAERIYQYPQVKFCNLMSGGFDLLVAVEGKTMKEVALFVAEKLATIDSVISTETHFVLKKYKENGVTYEQKHIDNREAVVL